MKILIPYVKLTIISFDLFKQWIRAITYQIKIERN